LCVWLAVIVAAVSAAVPAEAQLTSDLETRLRNLSASDLQVRSNSFYSLLRGFENNTGDSAVGMRNLLRAYPDQSELIKTTFIAALEREGSYIESTEDRGEQLSETATEYWYDLSLAVASLRDPRSLKGLLSAHGPGGIVMSYFADLCPYGVDKILEKSQLPSRYWRGGLIVDNRAGAMALLGQCLTRISAMQAAPDALAKARKALLAALGDSEPTVRSTAARALVSLRDDPEVHAKLELLAATDAYVSRATPTAAARFTVRDAARQALNGARPDDFYIIRTTDTFACRVEQTNSVQARIAFIGPISGTDGARKQMCMHLDRTGKDPSLCWAVSPQEACQAQP